MVNFAGVTHDMVAKNPPNSIETAKGHLDLIRANKRSTSKPTKQPQRPVQQSPPSPEDTSYVDSDERSIFAAFIESPTGIPESNSSTGHRA